MSQLGRLSPQQQWHRAHLARQNAIRHAAAAHEQDVRSLTGQGVNQERADLWADLFFYPINFGSMAAAAVSQGTVTIQADSHFEWMKTVCQGNKNAAAEPWPDNIILPITIFITDTGSGRQLMSAALPVNLIAGRGQLPFINPEDRIFKPSATIQVTATNFGASTYDNIWFAFAGRKIFKGNKPPEI